MKRTLCATIAGAALALAALPYGEAAARDKAKAERAFIEETRIAAPQRVGEFVLEGSLYEEAQKYAGAQFRYAHPDHPELRFDLFVYPAGDMPRDEAIERGMRDFRASFDAGVKLKYYDRLRIGDTTDFEIAPTPQTDGSEPAAPESAAPEPAAPENDGGDPEVDAAIATALAPKPLIGKRIDLRYRMSIEETGDTVAMRSRGYLFYKQLYYFKGRITVAESRMEPSAFDALSDRAIRALVPAVVASNIGGCAETTITIGRDAAGKDGSIADLLSQMLGQAVDKGDRNCHASRADAQAAEPEDAEIVTIEYDANDWGSP
ncbi:MAG: OadG family protein [Pseudomonadota bacterium]